MKRKKEDGENIARTEQIQLSFEQSSTVTVHDSIIVLHHYTREYKLQISKLMTCCDYLVIMCKVLLFIKVDSLFSNL